MKKFMYLIPLAAVALASCSNESVDSREQRTAANPGTALNIFPAVQGTTRGTVFTDANLTEFHVEAKGSEGTFFSVTAGSALLDPLSSSAGYSEIGTEFDKDVTLTSGKWWIETNKDYYWSSKGMSATFTAWAPKNLAVSQAYTVKPDIKDQEDILVAYNSGTGADFASGVPLNFQHVMSQVIIKALNKDADKYKIEVAGVKLTNIKNTGSLTLPTASTVSGKFSWDSYTPWATQSATANYTANEIKGTAASFTGSPITLTSSASQLTSEPFLLMPQTQAKADLTQTPASAITGAYFSVLVRVTDISASNQIYPTTDTPANNNLYFAYVAIPVEIDWKAGYKYTYTLNFSKSGIGKVDPTQPDDVTESGYPDAQKEGGDDILDGPVQLFFTVTVEDWAEGGASPLDM